MTDGTEYYYNLSTGNVEEGRQSSGNELMGPYTTHAEAQKALTIAASRDEKWEQDDDSWEEYGEKPAPTEGAG